MSLPEVFNLRGLRWASSPFRDELNGDGILFTPRRGTVTGAPELAELVDDSVVIDALGIGLCSDVRRRAPA